MKVLMCGRTDLFKYKGGDAVQIEQTALELKNLGVEVDITTNWDVDYSKYDLVHIFQLDWVSENYLFAKAADSAGKKIVLSPIHHNVHEVAKYDEAFAFGFRRLSKIFLKNQFHRDTLKIIYRAIHDSQKRLPAWYALVHGLRNIHVKTLKLSAQVLVQTELEAVDLKKTYGVEFSHTLVQNGVGSVFLNPVQTSANSPVTTSGYILCVGRIEARKNQLSIIEAVRKLREETQEDLKLVCVGALSTTHSQYVAKFNEYVKSYLWLQHFESLPYESMPALYKNAKLAVSASWFETTGLTSLEALFCGTNAVASGERAKEVLKNLVSYCDPASVESIAEAIQVQWMRPAPQLPEDFKNMYTWKNAAQKTLAVYQEVLKQPVQEKVNE